MEVWQICNSITSKSDWYRKVFDDIIIDKWREEIKFDDNFYLAIKLLQASAKGVDISKNCEWVEGYRCNDCKEKFKKELLEDPDIDEEEKLSFNDPKWFDDETNFYDAADCDHQENQKCGCPSPSNNLEDHIEYYGSGLLDKNLHDKCKIIISEIANNEAIDWHPGSNQQVRDIIHPSMYPYVKGVSIINNNSPRKNINYKLNVINNDDDKYDYQWLPSEFEIDNNNKVKVTSYINNLKQEKYPEFIPLIEEVFENYIPSLENVLQEKLSDRTIQVIVKVGSVILDKNNNSYPGGSWHIEGLSIDQIVATCIHYVDVDNITDSFLEFRKPTILNEENIDYPQSDEHYTRHHYGIEEHFDGVMNKYLGLIKCSEGSDVVFPNYLQHRVKEFKLEEGCDKSLRTILAFFVIDPNHKIISTKDVAPQQDIFTTEYAIHIRERLMFHRKYFVDKLNKKVFEREFSLCEH